MVASSSTSSSSSSSSSGHCQREEKDMGKFEPLHLHHIPPPRRHCKVKKHHRHRRHSYPPPPPHSHCRHHSVEHPNPSSPMHLPNHHHLPAPVDCPHRRPHKKDKLRMKPPKHLKKVHKLHRKLMQAYKLPKGARRGGHRHHHMHFPPPKFSTHFGDHHPPGCCLHSIDKERFSMEEACHQQEMSILHQHHPRCHGRHHHPPHLTHPLIKSEVAGGIIALRSPKGAEASAEPPIEAEVPPTSDIPPVHEPEPVMQVP